MTIAPRRLPAPAPRAPRVFPLATAALLCAGSAMAQRPLDGRAFVPPNPRCEIWVDLEAMRSTEVMEGLELSAGAMLFGFAEDALGFPLAALHRLRGYPPLGEELVGNDAGVLILEGTSDVITPAGADGTRRDTLSGYEVVVEDRPWLDAEDPSIWVSPKPGVVVHGAKHAIAPVLAGTQAPGVTPPELLSLSAGRGVLAHVVMACDDQVRRGLTEVLELAEGSTLTAPDYLMLRVRVEPPVEQYGDPTVHLDGRLRWSENDGASDAMAAHLQQQIAALKVHPRFAAWKGFWNKVSIAVQDRDVVLHLDMGRPRDAGSLWTMIAPALLLPRAIEAAAAPPGVLVPVQVDAPAPADGDGDGDGDGDDGDGKDGGGKGGGGKDGGGRDGGRGGGGKGGGGKGGGGTDDGGRDDSCRD
ncbi:MAG: hypothetical protein AB7O97_06780 [Planctomycetota bacterium]